MIETACRETVIRTDGDRKKAAVVGNDRAIFFEPEQDGSFFFVQLAGMVKLALRRSRSPIAGILGSVRLPTLAA